MFVSCWASRKFINQLPISNRQTRGRNLRLFRPPFLLPYILGLKGNTFKSSESSSRPLTFSPSEDCNNMSVSLLTGDHSICEPPTTPQWGAVKGPLSPWVLPVDPVTAEAESPLSPSPQALNPPIVQSLKRRLQHTTIHQ